MSSIVEVNKLKEELVHYKILNKKLTTENGALKREKNKFVQTESRNLRCELKNVKKKNKTLEKKVERLMEEINVLTKELEATNCKQPNKQVISEKLTQMKEREKFIISSTNETFYQRVISNLKDLIVDPFFHCEQAVIFAEREDFFFETYGGMENSYDRGTTPMWYDIEDEYEDYEGDHSTIPYQVIQNFDEVVTKSFGVSCHQKCAAFKPVFFERNEEISYIASDLFDRQYPLREVFEGDKMNSNFENFANMITQRYDSKKHPKSLEQIAMKSALQNGIPLNNLPKVLQMKAKHGYLTKQSPIPESLNDEGRYWYEALLTKCEVINVDHFRYSLKRRKECDYTLAYGDDERINGFEWV